MNGMFSNCYFFNGSSCGESSDTEALSGISLVATGIGAEETARLAPSSQGGPKEEPLSSVPVEVTRRVLLTEAGCRYLQEKFEESKDGADRFRPGLLRSLPSHTKPGFCIYYDTRQMILNRQFAWLRELDGEFDLQVLSGPIRSALHEGGAVLSEELGHGSSSPSTFSPSNTLNLSSRGLAMNSPEDIPAKLHFEPIDPGIVRHKTIVSYESIIRRLTCKDEMKKSVSFRKDEELVEKHVIGQPQQQQQEVTYGSEGEGSVSPLKSMNSKRLLETISKNNLKPFMKVKSEAKTLNGNLVASENGDGPIGGRKLELTIDLEVLRFDSFFAEPAALCAALNAGQIGVADKGFILGQGTFRIGCTSAGSERARSELDRFLCEIGLENPAYVRQETSALVAYFVTCRPQQLRSMLRSGITVE